MIEAALTPSHPSGPGTTERLVREVPAVPAAVGPLRAQLVDWARAAGAEDADGVALAVSEACTNAVLHAYVHAVRPGPLIAVAERVGAQLRVSISDHGCGLRPRADSPGLGLGLALITRLARHVAVATAPGNGTTVQMTFDARCDGRPA